MKDWKRGEVEAIPGVTMPALKVVRRDYKNLAKQYISFGPAARANGVGAHGTHYDIQPEYDESLRTGPVVAWEGRSYPSLAEDQHVCDVILNFATVTNGELAYRSYKNMEEKVGLPLAQLAEKQRSVRASFEEIVSRPRRLINRPMWSGLTDNGRAYSPFTYNVECLVPWRTLTGRSTSNLDHLLYLQFGEHLPTLQAQAAASPIRRPEVQPGGRPDADAQLPDAAWQMAHPHHLRRQSADDDALARVEPLWLNDQDAAQIDIADNDWVEVLQRSWRRRHTGSAGARGFPAASAFCTTHPSGRAACQIAAAEVPRAGGTTA